MRVSTISAAAAALCASTVAAIPTIASRQASPGDQAVAHIGLVSDDSIGQVSIPFGKLTSFENIRITTLSLEGITVQLEDHNIPIPTPEQVSCQRYQDVHGVAPGSAVFNVTHEALVDTNPVPFGWVLCWVNHA